MILRILPEADREAESARQYLNKRSVGLGNRFIEELSQSLSAIAERPLRFGKLETQPANAPYCRALLATFRYAVVFRVADDEDEIVVVAIVHTSREPNYWLGREA